MEATPDHSMVSIIIPLFNEEDTVQELYRRLITTTETLDDQVEFLVIDDGSTDRTLEILSSINAQDARLKALSLSRNFGHQVAITAGLDLAQGEAVVLMDGDLQDPPELLGKMIELWKDGYEVVYTIKASRKENILKRSAFALFYRVLHALSSVSIPMDAGNFSLMDRKVVNVFREMRERNRLISGMRAWAGFRQIGITYDRDSRYSGKPRMNIARLIKLALDGILSFSNVPLRIAIYLGFMTAVGSFIGTLYVMYAKLFTDKAILGWASTIVSILFVGGMILLTLGVIGEYVSRIYEEVKRRPLYVIREKIGL